ncbi:MAG: GTPase Era [Bacteroidota bacterium]
MSEDLIMPSEGHKAGFVNIIGRPNVGKSTLMNQMVGERLSIITSKAQTTRHRIMGILNGEDFQIVYSDTPGIIEPQYKLQNTMMHFVNVSLEDADILLVVTDVFEKKIEDRVINRVMNLDIPVFLLINKIDLVEEERVKAQMDLWKDHFPEERILTLSALEGRGVDKVFDLIIEQLPPHPPFFPKDELTNKSERFFASEIIREKIFLNYRQEVPYACEVVVTDFKNKEDIIFIRAEILVERKSQKGIIIGKKGEALKKLGVQSREELEAFFDKKVFLEQHVKVEENWRSQDQKLRRLGYHLE